jgi:hypothetical protein
MSSMENEYLDLPILLYLLALVGGLLAFRMPLSASRYVLFSVPLSLLPLLVSYRFRFFSGQGLLGVALLAGFALAVIQQRLNQIWRQRVGKLGGVCVPIAMTALLFAGNPTLFIQPETSFFAVGDSSFMNLALGSERIRRSNATSFYIPHLIDPLVHLVRDQTRPDEIIGCNLPYTCGLLAALSDRALATGMFAEVRGNPASAEEALRHAHVIVWLKALPVAGIHPLSTLQQEWQLTLLGETPMAYLLRNPQVREHRRLSQPVVPLWLAQVALWSVVGLVFADLYRHRYVATDAALRNTG